VVSSTSSPPTPSLYNGTSEQDEIFMPSPESRGHIYELVSEKMGRSVVSLNVLPVMASEQVLSACPESHASEDHVGLSECLVKANCPS
jgi:hypothetical protein